MSNGSPLLPPRLWRYIHLMSRMYKLISKALICSGVNAELVPPAEADVVLELEAAVPSVLPPELEFPELSSLLLPEAGELVGLSPY